LVKVFLVRRSYILPLKSARSVISMASAFFPVLVEQQRKDFDPYEQSEPAPLDLNDLAEIPDQLGTVCSVHHCTRFLDEAPLVPATVRDGDAAVAKRDLFPHSWAAIVSHSSSPERAPRRRTVTVRYCPACREAADQWFREHQAA
jgi:hypothetical protein